MARPALSRLESSQGGTSLRRDVSGARPFVLLQLLGESAALLALSRRPESAFCRIHIRAMRKHRHIFASALLGGRTLRTSACTSAQPPTRGSDVQTGVAARPALGATRDELSSSFLEASLTLGFGQREAPLLMPWLGVGDPTIPRPLSKSSGATGLFHCRPGLSSPSAVAGAGEGLSPAGPFALLFLQALPGGSQVKSNFHKNRKNSQEFRAGPGLGGMLGDSLRQGCVQTLSDCPLPHGFCV